MGKHKKSDSTAEDVVKQEPELQAVLLADSFTRNFRPISLDRSKVLCPLNNVTLLDYSLEFLAGAGVQEVFCVCTADDVEQHLARCKITGEMKVTCVKDASLTNAGDALRELDKRNLVQSNPFLLMHGDTLTNVDLSAVMEQHKQRHKQDNSAIMTILFQKVGAHNKLRPPASDLLVGFDPRDKRILVYDDHASNNKICIPCSFFVSHAQVELHDDLLDCGLDVCSPQVLARFSDEFDYRDIRREFVTNTVAEEEEGLQHKLHAHVLEKHHYAARVHDFCSYHCVSRDLLRRWCYPVVPDNLPNGYETSYRYALQRHYLYKEQHHPTKVGPSTLIQGPGMVGSHSHVGRDCNIVGTVIGHNCVIGNEVTMRDSHVWEQVTVEDGATVIQSILAHGVVIKKGAIISRGCVVGSGCVIGANVILPEFTRITKSMDTDGDDDMDDGFGAFDDSSDDEDDDSDLEQHQDSIHVCDYDVVGPDGVGRVWKPTVLDVDEDEDDEPHDPLELVKAQSIGYDLSTVYQERAALQQEGNDGLSDDDGGDGGMDADFTSEFDRTLTLASDTASSNVEQHGIMITGRQRGVDVVKELKTICLEHYGPIENLAIEMNSFKFSQNATYCDCTMAAMLAVLDQMEIDASMSAGKLVASLKSQLDRWAPLLRKMSIGLDEERSIVNALEMAATGQGPIGETLSREPSFRFLLQTLHEEEVVSEEAILSWAAERREEGGDNPRGKLFRQQPTQDFLEWLEEESEEEDSSEEEESD